METVISADSNKSAILGNLSAKKKTDGQEPVIELFPKLKI